MEPRATTKSHRATEFMWEVGMGDVAEAPSEPEQKEERGDPEGLLYKEIWHMCSVATVITV